jgi:hypothetical protein
MKDLYSNQEDVLQIEEVNRVAQTLLQDRVVISTANWSGDRIQKLFKRNQLDLQPWFQRGDVWNDEQRAKLVDSFLSKTPIPAVYMELYNKKNGYDFYRVIDGKQRLTSLIDFTQNMFTISYQGQPETSIWKNKNWNHEMELQDIFESREIPVIILDTSNCTEEERDSIEEYVFQRWNDQSSLKQSELRHSIKGILNIHIEKHFLPLFMEKYNVLAKNNKRMEVNEIIERILYRIYNDNEIIHSHPKHRELIKFHKSVLVEDKLLILARELEWVLMIISKNTKIYGGKRVISAVHKIDLIILGIDLLRKFGKPRLENYYSLFLDHFVNIVIKQKKLIREGAHSTEEINFNNKFNELFEKYRGGVNGSNKFRHEFWVKEFTSQYELQFLDKKRTFTQIEKELKWLEQDASCNICGEKIELKGSHGDHKGEWIMGYGTNDENLQILCEPCHKEKTANFNKKSSEEILSNG